MNDHTVRRVLLSITELEPGGAERAIVTLAERLDRNRWEPVVCALSTPPSPPGDALVVRLEKAGIPVHFLGAGGTRDLLRTLCRFGRLLRSVRPAIVQTFLFHATMVASITAGPAGIPICSGIRVADGRSSWRLRAERWVTRRWIRRVVCVSRGVADFSILNGVPESKVLVIPNAVESPEIPRRRFSVPGGPRRLTAIGRLTKQKGFDWLLDAMAELVRRRPEWNVTLRIVGSGEEEASLREKTERSGLRDRVIFAGWRPDVAEILRCETDLFVLSSRWEGMANVVLEAMGQGLPVLATDVEGVRELIDTPQIVPFGDTMAWCERCEAILRDPEKMREIGRRNRTLVVEDYSVDTMVRRYCEVWESVLKEPRENRKMV
ncbi:MAG: glycosyltransferase [Planctomycetia bacterium]|nr:glycosyltransferase [Planctomycetia bacterium]